MFCNTCSRDEDKAYKLLTFMIELHKKTQLFLLKSNSCEVSVNKANGVSFHVVGAK